MRRDESDAPVTGMIAIVVSACLVLAAKGCFEAPRSSLSSSDIDAIKLADQAYVRAWLANDREQVMATLTEDAVLLPSGLAALEGSDAIREFWWPADSPPTRVTEFTAVQREVGGYGELGFVRGSFALSFTYGGSSYSSAGEYMSILRRLPDGVWRISHRMWSDRPLETS